MRSEGSQSTQGRQQREPSACQRGRRPFSASDCEEEQEDGVSHDWQWYSWSINSGGVCQSLYCEGTISLFINFYTVKNLPAKKKKKKEFACNAGDLGSIPRVGRFPCMRHCTPVFLPEESPWTEEPTKQSDTTEWLSTQHILRGDTLRLGK